MTCQSLITYALRHELLVMTDVVVHVHVQQVDEVQQVGEVGHCDKVAHHGEVQGLAINVIRHNSRLTHVNINCRSPLGGRGTPEVPLGPKIEQIEHKE
jgi:hypothetical protein